MLIYDGIVWKIDTSGIFSSSFMYRFLNSTGTKNQMFPVVMLEKHKLNIRDLLGRNIECFLGGCAICHHVSETLDHLFSICPLFSIIWRTQKKFSQKLLSSGFNATCSSSLVLLERMKFQGFSPQKFTSYLGSCGSSQQLQRLVIAMQAFSFATLW